MVDVVFALTGDVRRNSRALRQIRALIESGLTVEVLSYGADDGSHDQSLVHVHWLGTPRGRGPLYFWENHWRMMKHALPIRAGVYHASDLYVLPALARAADRNRGSLVYDARELYPHVASTVGRPWVRLFWESVERHFVRKAEGVLTVSDGIADRLVDLYDIDRPSIVHNVPYRRTAVSSNRLRASIGVPTDTTIVLHQGQMRKFRGCELLLDAVKQVDRTALVFLGDGPLKRPLSDVARKHRLSEKVFFLDAVPPDELLGYTSSADIGVTLLEDVCLNHRFALPNKLFEYLAANIPVIASDLPEIQKVVKGYNVGIAVSPVDQTNLIRALRQASDRALRDEWRRNIPSVFEKYNAATASHNLLRLYDSIGR